MLLCMMFCGNLRRKCFRNSKNLYVMAENVTHEKPFQMLVLNLLMSTAIRGVECGGDSASSPGIGGRI
jgi:hypothetical protein